MIPRAEAPCIPFTKRIKRNKSMGIRRVASSSPCPILVTRVERSLLKSAESFPFIILGEGHALAQKSLGFPPPQSYKPETANGDLEGYWRHPAPGPGSEEY
eukprot:249170-Pelagomonas_calceolata.AAC.2